jgi:hypothetical protein
VDQPPVIEEHERDLAARVRERRPAGAAHGLAHAGKVARHEQLAPRKDRAYLVFEQLEVAAVQACIDQAIFGLHEHEDGLGCARPGLHAANARAKERQLLRPSTMRACPTYGRSCR